MKTAEIYNIFKHCTKIVTDSREIVRNSIFVALKGDTFDGNMFVASALERGAAFAIADDKSLAGNSNVIVVSNALETLQELAAFHRKQLGLPVLAITGSNGKTTTKELVANVIAKRYNAAVTKGNLNNHIGVPLTLLSIKPDNNFAIVEMGTNHFGEITALCKMAAPDFALINNIGKAHLEFFGDINGVAKAKGEMFEYLSENGGKAFVNTDTDIICRLAEKHLKPENIIPYNRQQYNMQIMHDDTENPFLTFAFNGITVHTKLTGTYNMENVMAAVAAGKYFNISDTDIADAIEAYMPDNNRSQQITTERNILYMDAYNANPTSMQASLTNFIAGKAKNRMLLLGDMRELGESSDSEHEEIVRMIIESGIDRVLLVGSCFAKAAKGMPFMCFGNVDECIRYIAGADIKNHTILIKGSHGLHLEKTEPYL